MMPELHNSICPAGAAPIAASVGISPERMPEIAGYTVEKRLGAGGSGEVWKATSSDGKTRAIKIVFGSLDERRAAQELKSLSRVKSLSHPNLLALESVAVIDGRVVIVTDLAEASLQDRFAECRAGGECGIPRDELMRYMGEAADALDYLDGQHGLQHLDVKPENLLLVGGSIRVADFGLLKDMSDGNASLINGLTPKYAAPEVFDGRPSRFSDQYSLAILFQEMATGTSPFSGRTAAQLASQHLHSMPDLAPLSPLERFAVGKALSKDPAMRFRNCREFVERLTPRSRTTLLTGTPSRSSAPPPTHDSRPAEKPIPHDGRTVELQGVELTRLPAIDLSNTAADHRPTVFLGIGHTGGKILGRLRQLLTERFGLEARMPALQMLYIDTDVDAINEVTAVRGAGKLQEDEILLLPIHSTWNYRNSHVSQIESISRRWLFNIPRSQKTEGLRALGRLALLDHADRVKARFRKAILAATENDAIAATKAATGLSFNGTDPRVFVVASPGGGTGGGMLIDAAYAMRQMLIETGFSDDQVVGILPFTSRHETKGPYLAPANALACLRELQYFSTIGDYPGEISCGLAGFREELPTFAHTYFLDLGERLEDEQFSEAASRIASYLLLNSVSPATPFFELARSDVPEASGNLVLRTAALESLGTGSLDVSGNLVDQLCRKVVLNWRGQGVITQISKGRSDNSSAATDKQATEAYLQRTASEHAADIGLDVRSLYKTITQRAEDGGRPSMAKMINDIVAESIGPPGGHDSTGLELAPVLRKIHLYCGVQSPSESEMRLDEENLREFLLETAQRFGHELGTPLEEWILALVDRSECRVSGAQQVAAWLQTRLAALETETTAQLKQARQAREELFASIASAKPNSSAGKHKGTTLTEDLRRYTFLLLQDATFESVLKCLAIIDASVCRSSDRLRDLWKDLNRLADEVGGAPGVGRGDLEQNTSLSGVGKSGVGGLSPGPLSDLTGDVRDEVERSFLRDQCPLSVLLARRSDLRPQLVLALREAAKKVVRKAGRQAALSQLGEALLEENHTKVDRILGNCFATIEAAAGKFGGAMRLLLTLPDQSVAHCVGDRVQSLTGELPTLVADAQGEMIVAYEIEQVPLLAVVNRLIRAKPDCESLAARLHTRTDVRFE